MVLQRVVGPENLASHMFALVGDRPEFASATDELRMLDSSGRLVDAKVTWVRSIVAGPAPNCGYLVQPDLPVTMPLDGPLLPSDWTAEINYLANSDGSMMMSLSEGSEVKVPVQSGTQSCVRSAAGRGRRDRRAGEHGRIVGLRGGRTGWISCAEVIGVSANL